MTRAAPQARPAAGVAVIGRIAWAVATLIAVQAVVCGISAAPVVLVWHGLLSIPWSNSVRWTLFSLALAPSYLLFALSLMIVSPVALRLLRWHTPPDTHMRVVAMEWPLLQWFRYQASIHVVRVITGTFVRGTPLWTLHLRLNGARLGKRVYVNSLSVSDYNLIDCGDDVVIGGAVHMAGHTVEAGVVKTARVRIGSNVTIGLGTVIEIGVQIGSDCQIGALSFVPKYANLPGGRIYAGAPAAPID